MDLKAILEKTKAKSDKVSLKRTPAYIAKQDRPYDLSVIKNENLTQIELKTDVKSTQTQHETDTNLTQKITQTDHKPDTNPTQIKVFQTQKEHKPNTQPDTASNTKPTQITHKPNTQANTSNNLGSLVGLQRNIILLIYNECKANRSNLTDPLTLEYISNTLKIRVGSIKTTVQRLLEKQVLVRTEYKSGRGGWAKYELPESIYREILSLESSHKLNTNLTQLDHKYNTQPNTQPDTSVPSSSGSNNINTTTTETELPEEWEEIDLSELQRRGVNFTRQHLQKLYPGLKEFSVIDIQESFDGLVFDIDNKKVHARVGYLNLLIGCLRQGNLYYSAHYVSPDKKLIMEMQERALARKREKELLESREDDEKFMEWVGMLSDDEILKMLPTSHMVLFKSGQKDEVFKWLKFNIFRERP
jgi:hypothetical protein